jgi:hypothetical protein
MSMNKTCPISNFTSDDCSDGMSLLLSQNSLFNELLRFKPAEDGVSDRHFVNVSAFQFGQQAVDLHFFGTACGAVEVTSF